MNDATLASARILVVDDEPFNVELLQDILEAAGYTAVTGLTDPRAVAGYYADGCPDLLLLDLLMPEIDGFGILRLVGGLMPAGEYWPVVVLTADITRETRQAALAAGATDFLTKPFDQIELLLRVRNLLRTRLLYLERTQEYRLLEQLRTREQAATQRRDLAESALTHDLQQPLTTLRVAVTMLKRELERDAAATERLAEPLALIERSSERLHGMTDELLDLARLHQERTLDLTLRVTDLVAWTRDELAARAAEDEGRCIRFVSAADHALVQADTSRLARVLANLLSNAKKYSPRESVITISLRREQDRHGVWWLLTVADAGIGIPAADLPRLFDRFYRAGNVAGRIAGNGVGLVSAKQIVEQHGGTLTIASREGEGATVSVRLPAARGS